MIKYYGPRGCGKTVKLLREAGKAVIDGKTVVFVAFEAYYAKTLKENAIRLLGVDLANKINFMSANDAKIFVCEKHKNEDIKVFIDEAEITLYNLLFTGFRDVDVTMALDTANGIEIEDWRNK